MNTAEPANMVPIFISFLWPSAPKYSRKENITSVESLPEVEVVSLLYCCENASSLNWAWQSMPFMKMHSRAANMNENLRLFIRTVCLPGLLQSC